MQSGFGVNRQKTKDQLRENYKCLAKISYQCRITESKAIVIRGSLFHNKKLISRQFMIVHMYLLQYVNIMYYVGV